MLPVDDADYVRVMEFAWDVIDKRGGVKEAVARWLK